ncbi:MAG: Asp23/Gls24 family envelope stress response protein [Thermoleophilia bacterium]|nr:Asp23/Gls24 family envelope stress response protein [Thermoleophilia bacterium]
MPDQPNASFTPEVIASSVWEAIRHVPGLVELHRTPFQSLGEKAHIERLQAVRLDRATEDGPTLDLHIVVDAGAHIPTVARQVATAGADYLAGMTGTALAHVRVHVDDVAGLDQE